VVYRMENKRRNQLMEGQTVQDDTADLFEAFSDLTDKENMTFRYKL
jgi:hypothetical protein